MITRPIKEQHAILKRALRTKYNISLSGMTFDCRLCGDRTRIIHFAARARRSGETFTMYPNDISAAMADAAKEGDL